MCNPKREKKSSDLKVTYKLLCDLAPPASAWLTKPLCPPSLYLLVHQAINHPDFHGNLATSEDSPPSPSNIPKLLIPTLLFLFFFIALHSC